jgi:hypothetical protein
MGNLKN